MNMCELASATRCDEHGNFDPKGSYVLLHFTPIRGGKTDHQVIVPRVMAEQIGSEVKAAFKRRLAA
jgi:hypothetical protein